MNNSGKTHLGDTRDDLYEILRGVGVLTQNPLVNQIAETIARFDRPDLSVAFNHRQFASKLWLCESLRSAHLGGLENGGLENVWILGGWYGLLAALLFRDEVLQPKNIMSIDLDPYCEEVARRLNHSYWQTGRFQAITKDMNDLDYQQRPDLIINTSCEHLPDVAAWRQLLSPGQRLLVQSNDYFREPDHLSCVPDLEAFQAQMRLTRIDFAQSRNMKNKYNRYMLIGLA